MGYKILDNSFFSRDTQQVARDLLGKVLIHQVGDNIYKAIISETEAYHGENDWACHCSKGKTPRTEVMYDSPGLIYVYLIYGMYHMLNFVTMPKGFPAAVLVRGVKDLQISKCGSDFQFVHKQLDGPGKLTKQLQITRDYHYKELSPATGLFVADENIVIDKSQIKTGKRIGVDYAKEAKNWQWRFYIE